MAYPRYPAYKDSGVEWLGEIPTHWNLARLKFAASINMGQSPSSEECNLEGKGLPFLQGNAEFGERHPTPRMFCPTAHKRALRGDLLLSVRAPVGELNVADQPYGIGRGLCSITPRNGYLNRGFAWYLIQVTRTELDLVATGSTYDAVSTDEVKDMLCLLPPLPEQRAIAAFLDRETAKIDALIAKQERLIALLGEKRAALISQAVTKGLDPDVPMRDSGIPWLGEIPADWEIVKTKYLFRLSTERAPENNDYELLSLYTDIGVEPRKDLEPKGNKASTTDGYWIVRAGDIVVNKLLTWMGAIGYSKYDGVTSPAYDILRKTVPLESKYYHYLFRCGLYLPEFRRRSRGIMDMRLRLYFDEFGQILVPYPSLAEQEEIVAHLDRETAKLDGLIAKAQEMIERLQEYRTALISAAVTGKMDVRES